MTISHRSRRTVVWRRSLDNVVATQGLLHYVFFDASAARLVSKAIGPELLPSHPNRCNVSVSRFGNSADLSFEMT